MNRCASVMVATAIVPGWCAAAGQAADKGTAAVTAVGPGVTLSAVASVLFGVVLVIVIIALGAWLLRRFGQGMGLASGVVRVIGGVSLGTRERLLLVQVGGQQILIGVAPGSITKVHELEAAVDSGKPAAASTHDAMSGFAGRLADALRRRGGRGHE